MFLNVAKGLIGYTFKNATLVKQNIVFIYALVGINKLLSDRYKCDC